jgi:hypothetical protein
MHFGIAGRGLPKFNNLSSGRRHSLKTDLRFARPKIRNVGLMFSGYRRQRYSAINNSAFPAQAYTACRGKRSYDIHEGQLIFLVKQGFSKVSEVSSMMGVRKKTLERRMRSFGTSVSCTKVMPILHGRHSGCATLYMLSHKSLINGYAYICSALN